MVGWYEIVGERADPKEIGKIRVNTFYETQKKPFWLIALKLLGVAAMIAVGFAMFLPFSPLLLWQSIVAISGVMLIYVGLAFFIRPEPNGDNMGFLGGFFNDPTHYSDNVNRALWNVHCMLGPGRFIAETILDCCTRVGFTAEMTAAEADAEDLAREEAGRQAEKERWRARAREQVEDRHAQMPGGQVELRSACYLDPDRFAE